MQERFPIFDRLVRNRASQMLGTPLFLLAIGVVAVIEPVHSACNIVGGKAYGDCAGVRITEGTKGYLTVRSHVSESAIIDGATVLKGGTLNLRGISNGDIIVHRGARLRVTGVVNGAIKNHGGNVEIEGAADTVQTTGGRITIGGIVGSVSGGGPITYTKGAVIRGVPVEKTTRTTGK